ncbi:MAG: DUF5675 family protein [Candidatus Thiodiazotropha sp.]
MKKVLLKIAAICLLILDSAAVLSAPAFTITIDRNMTCGDQSTIGRLLVNGEEIGRTLELPDRNNEPSISRIPKGKYPAKIRSDGSRKWRVELSNVQDREWIQIHVGNYQSEIEGCILVGSTITRSGEQCKVPESWKTLDKLANKMSEFSAELGGNQSVQIDIEVEVK